jgi:formylmethanofuran dehydrogenase subunit E
MDKILQQIQKFHGHLGPYVVLGYKMGEIASQKLGVNPFSKKAIVWTGTSPPMSCIIDGIQISSGCTLGKGNITVYPDSLPKAIFSDDKDKNQVEIRLKPSVQQEIDTRVTKENMIVFSEQLFRKPIDELFDIL